MSSTRSWLEQEQLDKPIILEKFWAERVNSTDEKLREHSLNAIKDHFLLALPKPGISQNEWIEIVNMVWSDGAVFTNKKEFFKFFDHISSLKSVGLAERLMPSPKAKNQAVSVTEDERKELKQYTEDRKITVSSVLGSVKTKVIPFCSENYTTSDVFTTQSITKVFTGVLALRMFEEKIITKEDLDSSPVPLDKSTENLLVNHPNILSRLKEATLHQALTHHAGLGVGKGVGLGDYYSNYINSIEEARKNTGHSVPEIKNVEDFLQFVPDQTDAFGKDHWQYSNSGIVLAALSLQHLYNKNRDKQLEPKPLSFDEIMKKYVTGPKAANMTCFTSSPKGLNVRFNTEDLNAEHMHGTPGGGYFSTAEDLEKFAKWMYDKCQKNTFIDLIKQYGQEFCPFPESKTIEHTGDGPSNSAFFSLNWETGNIVIVLNDQRAIAASEVGREIKDHVLSENELLTKEYKTELSKKTEISGNSSTAAIKKMGIDITTNIPINSTSVADKKNVTVLERALSHAEAIAKGLSQIKNEEKKAELDIAQEFIKKLQDATGNEGLPKKFWEDCVSHAGIPTFQEVLDKYAEYYKNLPFTQKENMSKIFWGQVKTKGTPIIEDHLGSDLECDVYFLMPKDKISDSTEKLGIKKDLYLQGDFHGYDSTDGKQSVKELSDTGIMLHRNTMPKDAIATYRYIQLEPSLGGKTPTQHHGSEVVEEPPVTFFPKETEIKVIPSQTKNATAQFWGKDNQLSDDYSTHKPPVIGGMGSPERIFRVSSDPVHAHLSVKEINWPNLLSAPKPGDPKKIFIYHDTLYSDQNGDLKHCETPAVSPGDLYSDKEPFSSFTRSIHIFKPASGKIDNVVVVNDGIAYLLTDVMEHLEKMVKEGKLSPNTAFVFVNPLPGLAKTISINDPKASMPGMGHRTIDYEHGIDKYIDFIANKLFPGLNTEDFTLPKDSSSRIMIGSSLSGTAGIYIGSQRPDLFGGVIAQSPSPSNRRILRDEVAQYDPLKPRAKIHLSCGEFEQPRYAANTTFPYATELSQKLDIPLQKSAHGHQFVAWTEELERLLPAIYKASHALDAKEVKEADKKQQQDAVEKSSSTDANIVGKGKTDSAIPVSGNRDKDESQNKMKFR